MELELLLESRGSGASENNFRTRRCTSRNLSCLLVGRGLYALKEWGYEPGTVADVMEKILIEKGPLSKKEIISEVAKQRTVKVGTISVNLQKMLYFKRVGRAVYAFDQELKK